LCVGILEKLLLGILKSEELELDVRDTLEELSDTLVVEKLLVLSEVEVLLNEEELIELLDELDGRQSASLLHPSSPGPGKIAHWEPKQSKCVKIHCASMLQRSDPGPATRIHWSNALHSLCVGAQSLPVRHWFGSSPGTSAHWPIPIHSKWTAELDELLLLIDDELLLEDKDELLTDEDEEDELPGTQKHPKIPVWQISPDGQSPVQKNGNPPHGILDALLELSDTLIELNEVDVVLSEVEVLLGILKSEELELDVRDTLEELSDTLVVEKLLVLSEVEVLLNEEELIELLDELDGRQSASLLHPSSPGPGKIAHWEPKQSKCVKIHCASMLQRSDPGPATRIHWSNALHSLCVGAQSLPVRHWFGSSPGTSAHWPIPIHSKWTAELDELLLLIDDELLLEDKDELLTDEDEEDELPGTQKHPKIPVWQISPDGQSPVHSGHPLHGSLEELLELLLSKEDDELLELLDELDGMEEELLELFRDVLLEEDELKLLDEDELTHPGGIQKQLHVDVPTICKHCSVGLGHAPLHAPPSNVHPSIEDEDLLEELLLDELNDDELEFELKDELLEDDELNDDEDELELIDELLELLLAGKHPHPRIPVWQASPDGQSPAQKNGNPPHGTKEELLEEEVLEVLEVLEVNDEELLLVLNEVEVLDDPGERDVLLLDELNDDELLDEEENDELLEDDELNEELLELLLLAGKHPHPRIPVSQASPDGQSPAQKNGNPPHGTEEELLDELNDDEDKLMELLLRDDDDTEDEDEEKSEELEDSGEDEDEEESEEDDGPPEDEDEEKSEELEDSGEDEDEEESEDDGPPEDDEDDDEEESEEELEESDELEESEDEESEEELEESDELDESEEDPDESLEESDESLEESDESDESDEESDESDESDDGGGLEELPPPQGPQERSSETMFPQNPLLQTHCEDPHGKTHPLVQSGKSGLLPKAAGWPMHQLLPPMQSQLWCFQRV
jgi:hypothetical protein